jgi:ATP-dependent RNA helicase RhlE
VSGISYTFFDPADETRLPLLQKLVGKSISLEDAPAGTLIETTPREETIEYERARDVVRRALDPTFKGAFHEKIDKRAKNKHAGPPTAPSKAGRADASFSGKKFPAKGINAIKNGRKQQNSGRKPK